MTPLSIALPFWADRPPREALEIAVAADELGYDELWVGELRTFDAFALAGAVASLTKRISVVVGPLPVQTRDPVSLALGVASVGEIGGRPAHLAIGLSSPAVVESWHGAEWRGGARRVRETVAVVRDVLRGERSPGGFRLHEPSPASTIAVAAFGPRMLRTANEAADRAVVNLLTAKQVARTRAELDVPLCAWVPFALDPGAETFAQLERQLSMYTAAPGYREMFAETGFTETRGLVEALCVTGDAGDVRAGLEDYERAGARVVVVPATANDPGGRKLLETLRQGEAR